MNLRIISAIIFFLLLGTLLTLTYYPNLPDMKVKVNDDWLRLDYVVHLGFYAAIVSSFLVWQAGWRKKISWKLLIPTLLVGLLVGIFTEYTQQSISGRSFNPLDMLYNCVGVVIGAVVMARY